MTVIYFLRPWSSCGPLTCGWFQFAGRPECGGEGQIAVKSYYKVGTLHTYLITFSTVKNFALVWSTVAHGISEPGPEWLCGNGWPMTTPVASVGWPSMAVAPTANTQVTHRHQHYRYNIFCNHLSAWAIISVSIVTSIMTWFINIIVVFITKPPVSLLSLKSPFRSCSCLKTFR